MEINSPNPLMDPDNGVQPCNVSKRSARNRKDANKSSDSVQPESSVQRRKIPNIDELMRSTPDVREEKVEKLRKKIRNGAYNIKAEKIAEKIIRGNPLDEIV